MLITTKVKIFLKKNTPDLFFVCIRKIADVTILKALASASQLETKNFKKRMIKKVSYAGGDFDIVIDPKNGTVDKQIYAKKLYEPHIVSEFIKNIKKGDVCVDVGANIGHHTIIMAQLSGKEGKVYAFEPLPEMREQMIESVALNKIDTIQIIPEGLSNKEETLDLYINEDNVGGSSLVNKNNNLCVSIQLKTLDSFDFTSVNFIKIDVEGFEHNVLLGAVHTIQKFHPTILFEFSPLYYQIYNPSHTKDILTFLIKQGYSLFDLEDKHHLVSDVPNFVNGFGDNLRSQTNILAVWKK